MRRSHTPGPEDHAAPTDLYGGVGPMTTTLDKQIRAVPDARRSTLAPALAAAALGAGTLLRFWPRSSLWLDEAQSVAFARLPLADIPHALREDGAPPLYYVLLHVWMDVFGRGDSAVRALSAICSLGALAVVAVVARRVGGTQAAVAAALLIATNPFAIRYASETRMYALVTLEVALLALSLHQCLRRDGRVGAHVAVALTAAALLYTHYWALYLLAATGGLLAAVAARRWRSGDRAGAAPVARVSAMIAAGFVAFVPWVPTMAFQREHTGTPWATPSLWSLVPQSARDGDLVTWVGVVVPIGCGLLVLGRAVSRRRSPAADTGATRLALGTVAIGGALAWVGATVSHSATVIRYTSVFFPLIALLAAVGLGGVARRGLRRIALAAACAIGLVLAAGQVSADRTPAGAFADVLRTQAGPDDVVVDCPDQLGPALARELEGTTMADRQLVFPPGGAPGRVDWIDYAERYADARPSAFAHELVAQHPDSTIWLAWSGVYPPTQEACTRLFESLFAQRRRGQLLVPEVFGDGDHAALWRFDPPRPEPAPATLSR